MYEQAALSPLGFRLFAQPGISIRSSRTSGKQALSALQVSWSSFIPLDRAESEIFRGVRGRSFVPTPLRSHRRVRPSVRHIYDGPSPPPTRPKRELDVVPPISRNKCLPIGCGDKTSGPNKTS